MYIVITIIIITISTRPHFGTDVCLDTSPDPLGISSESQSGLLERDPNTSLKEVGKLSTVTSLWATRITSYSRRVVSPLWPSSPAVFVHRAPEHSFHYRVCCPHHADSDGCARASGRRAWDLKCPSKQAPRTRSPFIVETDASVPVTELQAKSSSSEPGKGKTSLYIALSCVWSQSKCQDQPSNEARQMYTKDLLHQF